jgi:4'-phosphopantetheinyl transferase
LDKPLLFNLSNTPGLAVCLVSGAREGGVDVEDTERPGEKIEIADRFFAPSEVTALRALPKEAQRDRFFDYWTLKEAYIKARGMGLAIPLDQFAFDVAGPTIRIWIDSRLSDDAGSWEFALSSPTSRHRLAVALRGRGVVLRTARWELP